jgi:hypothetical protein
MTAYEIASCLVGSDLFIRDRIATVARSVANLAATARPMPREPPVIKENRPFRRAGIMLSSPCKITLAGGG